MIELALELVGESLEIVGESLELVGESQTTGKMM